MGVKGRGNCLAGHQQDQNTHVDNSKRKNRLANSANSGEVVSAVICFFETKDPVRAHENSPSKVSKFVAVQDATAAEVMPSMVEEMPWRIPPVGTPISSRDAGEFY